MITPSGNANAIEIFSAVGEIDYCPGKIAACN
jgi:hypothetical protein